MERPVHVASCRGDLKVKKTKKLLPSSGRNMCSNRNHARVTVWAVATVEECALLNPRQLVSGIIQACSWLISLDCIRTKLCWAIWSVSPKGAGLSCLCEGTVHNRQLCQGGHHATPELLPWGTPRAPCMWNCYQAPSSSVWKPFPSAFFCMFPKFLHCETIVWDGHFILQLKSWSPQP